MIANDIHKADVAATEGGPVASRLEMLTRLIGRLTEIRDNHASGEVHPDVAAMFVDGLPAATDEDLIHSVQFAVASHGFGQA